MAGGGSGGDVRRRLSHAGCRFAVDEAAVAGREGRQRSAIGFGLAVGGDEIGRGACRERGWISAVAVSLKKKTSGGVDVRGFGHNDRWVGGGVYTGRSG